MMFHLHCHPIYVFATYGRIDSDRYYKLRNLSVVHGSCHTLQKINVVFYKIG